MIVILIALGSVLAVVFALLKYRRAEGPPVAVTFNGMLKGGSSRNPFGLFTVTNRTKRTVFVSAIGEAPLDPDLAISQAFSSYLSHGEVQAHGTTQLQCLVAGKKGVPFRAVIRCEERSGIGVRAWAGLTQRIRPLQKVWNPPLKRVHTIYSEWYIVPSDYEASKPGDPAPNGSQPIRLETNQTSSAAGSRKTSVP